MVTAISPVMTHFPSPFAVLCSLNMFQMGYNFRKGKASMQSRKKIKMLHKIVNHQSPSCHISIKHIALHLLHYSVPLLCRVLGIFSIARLLLLSQGSLSSYWLSSIFLTPVVFYGTTFQAHQFSANASFYWRAESRQEGKNGLLPNTEL